MPYYRPNSTFKVKPNYHGLRRSRARMKAHSNSERAKLIRELDRVFSLFIRERDGQRCVQCQSSEELTCGHIYSRRNHSTRWDEENCHAQCWNHNASHSINPHPYVNWFVEKFGYEALEKLHQRFLSIVRFSNEDLREMISGYRLRLRKKAA